MSITPLQKYRLKIVFAVALAASASTFTVLAAQSDGPVVSEDVGVPGLVTCELRGFRYEYHAPTGRASLYDLRTDPRCATDVSSEHSQVVLDCRVAMELKFGVDHLESLRARYAEVTNRLRALGYL